MKVLILGGTGMLGHQIVRRLQRPPFDTQWTVRAVDHATLDVAPWLAGKGLIDGVDAMDLPALEKIVERSRPEIVVNCLGTIKQRDEAQDALTSITVNSLLPHRLATLVNRWQGRIVHFSTDCVFSGHRGDYTEADQSDAEDLYGKTKFLGEVAYPNALTLRTSIIGRELKHHRSLLDWFLSQRGKTVRGFQRHWWSGVTTMHLADVVAELLVRQPALSGLYQLSSGKISKFELLQLLRDGLRVDVTITPDNAPFCDRSLKGDRFAAAANYVFPGWLRLVSQIASDTTAYPRLA